MTVQLKALLVGGPTVLLRYAGRSVLTDPTFDEPGQYRSGHVVLTKLTPPATPRSALGPIDIVLLSHDQHADNLDTAGRQLLSEVPTVLSTTAAAERIPGVIGLQPAQRHILSAPDQSPITVTAVPAQHGPDGCEAISGAVIGFILEADGWPTVYISGDNASVEVAIQIGELFPAVAVALLFAGAANVGRFGDEPVTLNSQRVIRVAAIWADALVVPIHAEGWAHLTESRIHLHTQLEAAGLGGRLHLLPLGMWTNLLEWSDRRRPRRLSSTI